MKKKNPFVRTKQFHVSDGYGINWWIDEDDWEDFEGTWEDELASGSMKIVEERVIKGVDYNNWIIGNVYGDYEGTYVDEECPSCESLLVLPESCAEPGVPDTITDTVPTGKERHCSNIYCPYKNEAFITFRNAVDKGYEEFQSRPPAPKAYENLNLEEFGEKYHLKVKTETECVMCHKTVPVKEWFCIPGYAVVSYEHDNCENRGPSCAVPLGKEREYWNRLLGKGTSPDDDPGVA